MGVVRARILSLSDGIVVVPMLVGVVRLNADRCLNTLPLSPCSWGWSVQLAADFARLRSPDEVEKGRAYMFDQVRLKGENFRQSDREVQNCILSDQFQTLILLTAFLSNLHGAYDRWRAGITFLGTLISSTSRPSFSDRFGGRR